MCECVLVHVSTATRFRAKKADPTFSGRATLNTGHAKGQLVTGNQRFLVHVWAMNELNCASCIFLSIVQQPVDGEVDLHGVKLSQMGVMCTCVASESHIRFV